MDATYRPPAALVRRVVDEACNRGDMAVLADLLVVPVLCGALDQPDHELVPPPVRAHLPEMLAAFRAAVPDARWTILDLVAEGDKVVTRLSVQGTFSGTLVGLAPPGRPATLTGVAISSFAEGRLVALWLQADLLGLLEQLGVMPPLSLAQAVTMAQILHAGTLLAAGAPP